ncbi:MAG: Spy/CpxP family protein refolding chaperone [Burkholderiales bacterium]|nr:Spy/CpxP family protein refolding chaperone [Burkholderiales bacterium]
MSIRPSRLICTLFALVLTSTLGFAWADDAKTGTRADAMQHHAAMVKKMEEHAAKRLNLTAEQQPAWQEYTATVESTMADMRAMHKEMAEHKDMDAAAMMHMRADHAATKAQELGKLADATDKFEKVLNPEQKKTFDEMARHFMHRHGRHGWHHGWDHDEGHEHHENDKAGK